MKMKIHFFLVICSFFLLFITQRCMCMEYMSQDERHNETERVKRDLRGICGLMLIATKIQNQIYNSKSTGDTILSTAQSKELFQPCDDHVEYTVEKIDVTLSEYHQGTINVGEFKNDIDSHLSIYNDVLQDNGRAHAHALSLQKILTKLEKGLASPESIIYYKLHHNDLYDLELIKCEISKPLYKIN